MAVFVIKFLKGFANEVKIYDFLSEYLTLFLKKKKQLYKRVE